jgi:hypothetical protein
MFGCSKDEAVTPATPELSILGKWSLIISRSTENSKTVYEYVGKTGDYIEFTTTDLVFFMDNDRGSSQYKVIEKNKKIVIIGGEADGSDSNLEIRNLTAKTMTLYQEYKKDNITYVNYIDLKK